MRNVWQTVYGHGLSMSGYSALGACNLEVPGSSSALAASWLVPGSKTPPGLACLLFLKLIICLLALKYILQIIGVGL